MFPSVWPQLGERGFEENIARAGYVFSGTWKGAGTDVWHPSPPPPPTSHPPPQPSDPPPEEEEPGRAQAAGALATLAPLVRTQHHLPSKMLPDTDFSTVLQSGGIWDNLVMGLASGRRGVVLCSKEWEKEISKLRSEMQDFALFYHHRLPAHPGKKSSAFKWSSEFYFHGRNIKKKNLKGDYSDD